MLMVNLFCPRCQDYTAHELNRWQNEPGRFDAFSAMCTNGECMRMAIMMPQELRLAEKPVKSVEKGLPDLHALAAEILDIAVNEYDEQSEIRSYSRLEDIKARITNWHRKVSKNDALRD